MLLIAFKFQDISITKIMIRNLHSIAHANRCQHSNIPDILLLININQFIITVVTN